MASRPLPRGERRLRFCLDINENETCPRITICWRCRAWSCGGASARKEISPVELLEACHRAHRGDQSRRQRHLRHRATTRARREAKAAEKAARAASRSGCCTGCRPASRTCDETEGLLTTLRLAALSRLRAGARLCHGGRVREAGAVVVGKTNVPEFGAGANTRNPVWGATGNPFDPDAQCRAARPAARRWRSRATCCRSAPAPTPAARCASRPPCAAWSASARRRAWSPVELRGLGLDADLGARARWAARSPIRACCSRPRSAMDDREPLAFPLGARAFADRSAGRSRQPARGLDRGFRPVPGRQAGSARLMRERIERHAPPVPAVRRGDVRLRRGGPVLRRDPRAELRGALPRRLHQGPELARAQHARQLRDGRRHDARPTAPGRTPSRPASSAASRRRSATTTSCWRRRRPYRRFPWTQLYLAEMEGKQLRNYYHWLALTYFITLATNPAISLPCGVDHKGMPFGLQVIGPLPRRRRGAGRRRSHGGGVHAHPRPRPSAPGSRPARRRVRRPQVAGDASAGERREAHKKEGHARERGRLPTCQAACEIRPPLPRSRGICRCPCSRASRPAVRRSADLP